MPATIIGNSEWTSRGFVLTAQDAQEQVNGLVNVQVTYVGPASKHDQISRSFYVDAPPPIWPQVVSPSELVTNRLYMESRSVTRANGLTTVQANYVGGLQRAGFRGYFLREQLESSKAALYANYTNLTQVNVQGAIVVLSAIVPPGGGAPRNVVGLSRFIYDEKIKLVEFVRINNASACQLPVFTRSDVASILVSDLYYAGAGFSGVQEADVWKMDGPTEAEIAGLLSFEKTTPVPYTESVSYVTPTVQIVALTYRLSR
jgi:hypothetical protein